MNIKPLRTAALSILALATIATASSSANALNRFTGTARNQIRTSFRIRSQVTTSNITTAYFPGGKFVRINGNTWMEQGDNGSIFNFVQMSADANFVYLNDASAMSRSPSASTRARSTMPSAVASSGPLRHHRDVDTGRSGVVSQNPPRVTISQYSCNEGIPLIVRFEEINGQFTAFASHDSLPEIRLPQVVSGSGNLFESGSYQLHTKGRQAYLNFNGIEDSCRLDR
ncbi:MAG: MliC family protein [Nitratireductor sp.]